VPWKESFPGHQFLSLYKSKKPSPKWEEGFFVWKETGGGAGNRTRVLVCQRSSIYMRSPSLDVALHVSADKPAQDQLSKFLS